MKSLANFIYSRSSFIILLTWYVCVIVLAMGSFYFFHIQHSLFQFFSATNAQSYLMNQSIFWQQVATYFSNYITRLICLSIIPSIISICLFYRLLNKFFDRSTAINGFLILVSSPFLTFNALVISPNALFFLLLIIGFYFFYELLCSKHAVFLIPLSCTMLIGIAIHIGMLLFLLSFILFPFLNRAFFRVFFLSISGIVSLAILAAGLWYLSPFLARSWRLLNSLQNTTAILPTLLWSGAIFLLAFNTLPFIDVAFKFITFRTSKNVLFASVSASRRPIFYQFNCILLFIPIAGILTLILYGFPIDFSWISLPILAFIILSAKNISIEAKRGAINKWLFIFILENVKLWIIVFLFIFFIFKQTNILQLWNYNYLSINWHFLISLLF